MYSVPPILKHIQTHFSISYNHICQKVTPDLKFLEKKLLDGTLKPGKIKSKVFLNSMSKKVSNSKKEILPYIKVLVTELQVKNSS